MLEILTPFLLGLLGSLHCAGMCGPIALSLSLRQPVEQSKLSQMVNQISYNLGRISSYSILGLLGGLLGQTVHVAGWQKGLSIGTGIFMILFLFFGKFIKKYFLLTKFFVEILRKINFFWQSSSKKNTSPSFFVFGLINGFLPCGFVYMALATSITLGSIPKAILFMILFGLGTSPMMASIFHLGQWLSGKKRVLLVKCFPFITFLLAIVLILRGLSLNIPYVSPDLSQKGCAHCSAPRP